MFRGAKQRAPGPSPFNSHNPTHGALGGVGGSGAGLYSTPAGPVCRFKCNRASTRRARALGLAPKPNPGRQGAPVGAQQGRSGIPRHHRQAPQCPQCNIFNQEGRASAAAQLNGSAPVNTPGCLAVRPGRDGPCAHTPISSQAQAPGPATAAGAGARGQAAIWHRPPPKIRTTQSS